ncbi:YceI family protein [Aeromicrobium sp.]|uniref:YceI family protein n=1 Tax=Aeromicrobium sp. TaxID=1871063 RepID=UPI003C491D7D
MSTATAVTAGTWTLDPTHTEIGFTVRHLIGKVRGKFTGFEGAVVTAADLGSSSVKVEVDLSTIDTGTAARDEHLRSSDFFEVESHPTMTFVSTGVAQNGASDFVVTGDLTIRGVSRSVELATEFLGEGGDPWGGTRVGVEATTQISRREFGIDFNMPVEGSDKLMIGDKISIHINAQAVLQA